jgi:dipeptidyl aminopeptidase/acylaminoacyl peptidase
MVTTPFQPRPPDSIIISSVDRYVKNLLSCNIRNKGRRQNSGILSGSVISLFLILGGCASSTTVSAPESTDMVEESLPSNFVWVDSEATVIRDRTGKSTQVVGSGGEVSISSLSSDGKYLVLARHGSEGSSLELIEVASGTVQPLHSGDIDLVYSGAWAPGGGDFAFGYFAPDHSGNRAFMGKGGIERVSTSTGAVSDVGCTASKMVLAWPRESELVVRNTDNLFLVGANGCATISRTDVRKWHHVSVSPTGTQVAYILRELSFVRETRTYEPDSTLYVTGFGEAEGTKIAGDRYSPRNLSWSPDGTELAFDVGTADSGRAVSVFSVSTGESVFLNAARVGSEMYPVWGPGNGIAYVTGAGELMYRATGSQFATAIDLTPAGDSARRLVGWIDSETAAVTGSSGKTYAYNLTSKQAFLLGVGIVISLDRPDM